ncbi:tape measure protein [Enterococcus sp. N249-2]
MSRSDGKVTIDIIVNGKQVTKEIDTVEQGFSRLGKNADDVMKKVGSDMGVNTESGAKSANKAVDSIEKSVSELGKTTESSTAKAGKSLGDNFDTGAKGANQATDSVVKGIVSLTATTSTELAKSGRVMGESFESGAKEANQANDSVTKSVASLVASVESSTPGMGKSISESFLVGAKQATTSTDMITKSAAQMVPQVELSSTKAGNSIAKSLEAGSKDGSKSVSDAVESMKKDLGLLAETAEKTGSKTKEAFDTPEPSANTLTGSVGNLSTAMLIAKGAAAALTTVKGSMDSAFGRIDTLDNFERTMTRLTGSSDEAAAGMEGVRDVVTGTSYTLDGAAQSVQRLVLQNKDIEKSTKSYAIWGDAVAFYGDGSAETMDNVMDAIIQMRATGTINMAQMDRIVRRGIDPWQIYADATGKSVGQVRDTLRAGEIDAGQFLDTVEHAMREGEGAVVSVAGAAQEAGNTWSGSFANMATATARGTANIITSMDDAFGQTRYGSMKDNVQDFGKNFEKVLNGVADVIPPVVEAVEKYDFAIMGLLASYAGYTVVNKMNTAITAKNAILAKTLIATKAQMAAQIASTKVTEADIVAKALQTKQLKLSGVAAGVMTGSLKASTAATAALTAAKTALTGPIGWVTLAAGAGVAAWKLYRNATEDTRKATKELTDEMRTHADAAEGLVGSVDASKEAYQEQQKEFGASAGAMKNLATEIDILSQKENLNATEKQMLQDRVDQLNGSIHDLNLEIDAEAGNLSMSADAIRDRIDAQSGAEEANAVLERSIDVNEELIKVENELNELAKKREEWDELVQNNELSQKEYKKALGEVYEQEDALGTKKKELVSEGESLANQEADARRKVSEATKESAEQIEITYDNLNEAQQKVVDTLKSEYEGYVSAVKNSNKEIETANSLSVEDWRKTMEANQKIMNEWAENVDGLTGRVSDQMLSYVKSLGPEHAGLISEMVNMSDEELKELEKVYVGNYEAAEKATIAGFDDSQLPDEAKEMVFETEQSMRQAVEEADFKSLGKAVAEGAEEGVKEGTEDVKKVTINMAEEMNEGFRVANEINSPSKLYRKHGKSITEGLAQGIDQNSSNPEKAMTQLAKKLIEIMEKELNANQMGKQIGKPMVEGIAQGIDQNSSKVLTSIAKMTDEMVKKSKKAAEDVVKEFEKMDRDVDRTLQNMPRIAAAIMRESNQAYREGMRDANDTIREGAQRMPDQMSHLPDQFYRIGQNSMIGLNNGLVAGQAQVLNTAANIANQVARTMQRALDINSPSRVMEMDVGRWIPAGIGEGIERFKHLALDAIEDLGAQLVLPNIQAESVAIASNAGFGLSLPAVKSESTTNNQTIHNSPRVEVHLHDVNIHDNRDVTELSQDIAQQTADEYRRSLE